MIAAAAGVFGRRGVEGASFTEILRESGAPRGSIYYYFPAGKPELALNALRWTTEAVLAYQRSCRARTPRGVVHHFVRFFERSLRRSSCRDGCPLAAVAVAAYDPTEGLQSSVRAGFRSWVSLLTDQLRTVGLSPRRARTVATATVASVEGALILARSARSLEPLEAVDSQLQRLAALPR